MGWTNCLHSIKLCPKTAITAWHSSILCVLGDNLVKEFKSMKNCQFFKPVIIITITCCRKRMEWLNAHPKTAVREMMPYLDGNFRYWARLTVIQMMRKMMPMENKFVWRKLEDFYNSYFFCIFRRHEEITTKSKSLPINNSLKKKSVFISLSFFAAGCRCLQIWQRREWDFSAMVLEGRCSLTHFQRSTWLTVVDIFE